MSTPALPRPSGPVHHLRRMVGRDPHEQGRVATPLELLFDLTFVAAFGIAGNQMAHLLAEGHVVAAVIGFSFAVFAISWAWINFTWFASAFDTDDWFFRVTTMVQMVGVVILALGLGDLFHSLDEGHHVDNRVMVAGYVVMRVAMLVQWLRVAAQSPEYRTSALTYAAFIFAAQVGWVIAAVIEMNLLATALCAAALFLVEVGGPLVVERRRPTPWHPHHVAERYGLIVIIALGEGVLGTVAAVQPIIDDVGWTGDAFVLVGAGIALTFGIWWAYFAAPWADLLHRNPNRSFAFGYLHIVLLGAVAAMGAGLHVAAYVVEGTAHVGFGEAVRAVAYPVALFIVGFLLIHSLMVKRLDPIHLVILAVQLAVLVVAVVLTSTGTPFALDILLVAVAPWLAVLGFEIRGHRQKAALEHTQH